MRKITILVSFFLFTTNLFAQTYYVKPASNGGSDAYDGLSWATAKANPQSAINTAETNGGGEVWIASGTYNPTLTQYSNNHNDSTRYYTFTMKNSVKVYGGFLGTSDETKETRQKTDIDGNGTINAWEFTNETIFSGEIQNDADSTNNSYHIVIFPKGNNGTALINGISVTDGYNDTVSIGPSSSYKQGYASGIFSQENGIIDCCIITKCYFNNIYETTLGAGVYNYNSSMSNCLISDCSVIAWHSLSSGVYNHNSSLINCIVRNNKTISSTSEGGGVYNNSNSIIINCIVANCSIHSNDFDSKGGGVYNYNSAIINCNIINCYSSSEPESNNITQEPESFGAGVYNIGESIITNCIIWGNQAKGNIFSSQVRNFSQITYSAIQDQIIEGDGNIILSSENLNQIGPMFKSPSSFIGTAINNEQKEEINKSNWYLLNGSICINKGLNDTIPNYISTELDGNVRILQETVDLGAYETNYSCISPKNLKAEFTPKTEAKVNWDPGSTEKEWNIEWGEVGFSLGNGNRIHIDTNSYILTDLLENTFYQFFVQAICGDTNNESTWIGPLLFTNAKLYVKEDGDDGNNGTSWETALANPQTAINIAYKNGIEQIWIAGGTYKPILDQNGETNINPRNHTFLMRNGVEVYGGFSATEGETIEARIKNDNDGNGTIDAWEYNHETIFSGEIQNDLDSTNNSYHIVIFPYDNYGTALLNGISITDGYSNIVEVGPSIDYARGYASGIYALNNAKIENCIIKNCSSSHITNSHAGGVYNNVNTKMSNCYIKNCYSYSRDFVSYGAGIYNNNNNTITNCKIENCISQGNNVSYGGGIYNFSTSRITDCTIVGCKSNGINRSLTTGSSSSYGGGIYNNDSSFITNCKIFNCSSYASAYVDAKSYGGGIYNSNNSQTISCSITNCLSFSQSRTPSSQRYSFSYGGGIMNDDYSSTLNCSVNNCSSFAKSKNALRRSKGGGICGGSNIINSTVTNCSSRIEGELYGNSGTDGAGISSNLKVSNCIIWNNYNNNGNYNDYTEQITGTSISYCAIQGQNIEGDGNINLSENNMASTGPMFINPSNLVGCSTNLEQDIEVKNANWRLLENSLCIDTGNNESVPNEITTDINGNNRILNGIIDIGAYEYSNSPMFTINTSIGVGGAISPANALVSIGDNQSFIITCEANYYINIATFNSNDIRNDIVRFGDYYIFTVYNVSDDGILNITFSKSEYILVAIAGIGGIVTPTIIAAEPESNQTFTIIPEIGFEISTLTYNGTDVLADLEFFNNSYIYTVSNVQEDGELDVEFSMIMFNIIANAGDGGSISPTNSLKEYSDSIIFYITPDAGKTIETAEYNGVNVIEDIENNGEYSVYKVFNITADGEFNITFTSYNYTITATAGIGGVVFPTIAQISSGENQTFTITCETGYKIESATYNNVDILKDIELSDSTYFYIANNITEDGALNIYFSNITGIDSYSFNDFIIFPNPTRGIININLPINTSEYKLRISDISGRTIINNPHFTKNYIDISNLPKGTYQVSIEIKNHLLSKIIIKK